MNKELSWEKRFYEKFGFLVDLDGLSKNEEVEEFIRETLATEKKALLKKIDRIMTRRWKHTDIEGEYKGVTELKAKLKKLEKKL